MLTWGLAIGILFVAFATPPIVHALIGLPLPARMTVAMAIVAPLAFLMGMAFPLGIRVLGARGGMMRVRAAAPASRARPPRAWSR